MADETMVSVSEEHLKNIERKIENYKTLTEISAIISSTLDLKDLMGLVMEKAKQQMEAEACSILFYNKDTNKLEFEVALCQEYSTSDLLKKKITLDMGQGIAGWVAENLQPLVIEDVKSDKRFYPEADRQTGFKTESLIAVPLIGRSGLIGVAELINPRKKDYDPEIFKVLCRQFAIAIENALFHRDSIEQEKLRQELEIASALQKSFLPPSPVFRKGAITAKGINIPAAKVGGDIYDFMDLAGNKAGIFIGDVSGKGVSGAVYMAKIISDLRYIGYQTDAPEVAFNRLNAILSNAPRGMFLTAVYIIIDTDTGDMRIAAAGHPPFLLVQKTGVKVEDVLAGPPIGILPVEYPSTAMSLSRGDRLLLFTDGVFEAKNRAGKRIGFENFVRFVKTNQHAPDLTGKAIEYVDDFSQGMERADDLTMVEIKWTDIE